MKVIEKLLDFIPPDRIHAAVVFTGDAEFKTGRPAGVFTINELAAYISQFAEEVISPNKLTQVAFLFEAHGRAFGIVKVPPNTYRRPTMPSQVRQIITIYCLCDDFLRAWGHKDAPQAKMTRAEVMTVALVASAMFCGNHDRSRCFLKEHGYIKKMLSKGHFNRRLHEVPETLWQALFGLLADAHKQRNPSQHYAVDSLPVSVCDNYRICRSRLYPRRRHGEAFRGYIASKRRFFYGLRVHLLMTTSGLPVEVMLAPGSEADISAFRRLRLALPPKAHIFADAGYLDQHEEALLQDAELHLVSQRRSNSKRPLAPWVSYIARRERKRIETVFSQIAAAFGRNIHAVTPRGFELKVFLTVLAYAIMATV